MGDKVQMIQMLSKVQPVLRITPIRKVKQEEQRMSRNSARDEHADSFSFQNILAEEGRRYEQNTDLEPKATGNYSKDAREFISYSSRFDMKQ